MSEYWDYECRSHTPPLRSNFDRVAPYNHGQYVLLGALATRAALVQSKRDRDPAIVLPELPEHLAWLIDHPTCDIAIVNEYGEDLAAWEERRRMARPVVLGNAT